MANSINGVIYDSETVLDNRNRFLQKIEVDIERTVCMWVKHGDKIVEADPKRAGISMIDYHKAIKTDGLMTNKKYLYLFLLVADCIPIILYDAVRDVIALVHAGWKGVGLEIAKKAVNRMRTQYHSKPQDIVVGIGPCVFKDSFIKLNPSQKDDPKWKGFIKLLEKDLYTIDLISFTEKQLIEAGVNRDNILKSGINTAKNTDFFSHVREKDLPLGKQGRFACIVGLK